MTTKAPKLITFQILRNTAPYKKIRSKSLEEAIGEVKNMAKWERESHFEIKTREGKLIQIIL